jgi:ectoine hydroxylase
MLTASEIATYRQDGVLVLPGLFEPSEIGALQAAFERDATIPGEHRIAEPDGTDVRAVYASHTRQAEYRALTRSSRLLQPAHDLLGPEVYLYQLKINAKPAFGGDMWAWHQDYVAWKIADNIPGPALINVVVFLDDVSEFNGPIIFVPASHTDGLARAGMNAERRSDQHLDPEDIALSPDDMALLVERHGLISPKGPAGTVVFFHPELVHGSAANMSPFPRRLVIVTYNQVGNTPRPVGEPRPEYLVCRNTQPLDAEDGSLISEAVSWRV